jgi:outer membrane protein OmpA-like peptidoglycan-associated protein
MKKTMFTSLVAFLLLATTSYGQVLSSAHSVYFGSGSSVLTAEAKAELTTIATRVKDKSELKDVVIYGYASKEGGTDYNLNLSNKRLDAVYSFLKDQGVPEAKLIKKVPRGEEQPRSKWYKGEPEPEGAKARFVELIVTPKIDLVDPSGAPKKPE